MKNSKHTPGPWSLVGTKNETLIGIGLKQKPKGEIQSNGRVIARVPNLKLYTDEQESNAHLIAASPDMLEALEELVNLVEYDVISELKSGRPVPKVYKKALDAARGAIAKARGE